MPTSQRRNTATDLCFVENPALTIPAKKPPTCSNCHSPLVEVFNEADPNYATFNPATGKYEWNTNPEQASFYCEECNTPLGEEEIIVWESLA